MFNFNDQQAVEERRQALLKSGKYTPKQVDAFISEQKNIQNATENVSGGYQKLNDLPQELRIAVAANLRNSGVSNEKALEVPFAKEKAAALDIVKNIEPLYSRGNSANLGTGSDLSLGGSGSLLDKIKGGIKEKTAPLLDPKLIEDKKIYENQQALLVSALTQSFGSGAPQEGEYVKLIASMPTTSSTDREAQEWFRSVKKLLGEKPTEELKSGMNSIEKTIKATENTENANAPTSKNGGYVSGDELTKLIESRTSKTSPTPTAEFKPEGLNILQQVRNGALSIADAAPLVGSIVGGIGGSAVGAAAGGVGALPLGILGSVGGGGAGYAIKQSLRSLLGADTPDALAQLQEMGTDAAWNAASEVLGFGAGKAITATISKGKSLLLKAGGKLLEDVPLKQFEFGDTAIRSFAEDKGEDLARFMARRGYYGEGAVDLMAKDANKLQNEFDKKVISSGLTITQQDVSDAFMPYFKKMYSSLGGSKELLTKARGLLGEYEYFMEHNKGSIPISKLVDYRRAIDDLLGESAFKMGTQASEGNLRTLREIYNDTVYKKLESKLIGDGSEQALSGYRAANKELSKIYSLMKMVKNTAGKGRGAKVTKALARPASAVTLGTIIGGGLGAGGGTILGGLGGGVGGAALGIGAGVAAENALSNPKVLGWLFDNYLKSQGGKIAGKTASKAGEAAIQDAFSSFMKMIMASDSKLKDQQQSQPQQL